MKSGIKALIPVRSGSVRVANKNLAPFAGSSLLEIKIQQLLRVPGLDEICVSSDDESMLEVARKAGATAIPRDPYYASNVVPMSEVYSYMAAQVDSEHILLTHVTNPLVGPATYGNAVESYIANSPKHDSLTTVAKVQEFLYLDGKAINYDPMQKPRSQDLPSILRLTHAISILTREMMVRKRDSMGNSPYLLELTQEESIDIDTPLDFEIAEFVFKLRHTVNLHH